MIKLYFEAQITNIYSNEAQLWLSIRDVKAPYHTAENRNPSINFEVGTFENIQEDNRLCELCEVENGSHLFL